ncbi:MAG: ATP-binding protein [Acidaminobacteraceae bacterium]
MIRKLKYVVPTISIIVVTLLFIFGAAKSEEIFELDGDWELYDEMLLYPSDFKATSLPDSQVINIPKDFVGNLVSIDKVETYGTIKKEFYLYDFKKNEILTIKNDFFRENSKIWIDGKLIIDTGEIYTDKFDSKIVNSTSYGQFIRRGKKIEVLIQFSKFNYYNFSSSGLSISKVGSIMKRDTRSIGTDLFMLGSILVLCIYHLIFYFKSKTFGNTTGALYFALLFFMIALRIINIGDYFIIELFPGTSFEVLNKLGFWSFYSLFPLLILFNNEIFTEFYSQKYIAVNKYILYILMLVVLLLDFEWYSKLMIPYIIFLLISVIYNIKINVLVNPRKMNLRRLAHIVFAITIFVLASDFVYKTNIYRVRTFTYIGAIIFMIVISTLISNRYNSIFNKVQVLASENLTYVDEIRRNNHSLENKIASRTQELTNAFTMLEVYSKEMKKILDNAGQGFLTIDERMMVSGEFSKECYKIFGEDIKEIDISEKLFPYNIEQKLFFQTIIKKIYSTNDENQSILYISLLPREVSVRGRLYSIKYKLISSKNVSDSIMLILTDITETKELEFNMIEKQNLLNMIVNVVIYYDEFLSLVSSYIAFAKIEVVEVMNSKITFPDKLFSILKDIHTFKGLFHRFGMLESVKLIHSLETEIFEIQDDIESYTPRSLLKLIVSYNIMSYIDKDMSMLKEKLGKNFLNDGNYIKIHKDKINDLIEEAKNSNYNGKMIDKLKQLKLVSFKKMFAVYPDLVADISSDMGKQLLRMKVEGDDFEVESKKYERVIKSLVHVYRNAISHGIEFDDERASKGKKTYGYIRTKIESDDTITITIEDDGAGISVEKVKHRLISKYGYTEDYFVSKSDNEILKMIFKTGYTSIESKSILSGRGVGLSSFIDEVQKINGNVKIETKLDKYTKIIIELPKFNLEDNHKIEKENFINAVTKSSSDIIARYLGSSLIAINKGAIKVDSSMITMYRYSSYMEIHGDVDSRLLFSFDEGALNWVKNALGLDDDETSKALIEDSIAEITNIILGNSASLISEISSNIMIGMPVVINDISTMNLSRFDVYEFEVNDIEFNMKVYMVFNKE